MIVFSGQWRFCRSPDVWSVAGQRRKPEVGAGEKNSMTGSDIVLSSVQQAWED